MTDESGLEQRSVHPITEPAAGHGTLAAGMTSPTWCRSNPTGQPHRRRRRAACRRRRRHVRRAPHVRPPTRPLDERDLPLVMTPNPQQPPRRLPRPRADARTHRVADDRHAYPRQPHARLDRPRSRLRGPKLASRRTHARAPRRTRTWYVASVTFTTRPLPKFDLWVTVPGQWTALAGDESCGRRPVGATSGPLSRHGDAAGRPALLHPGRSTFGAPLISRPLRWAAQGAAVAVVAVGALTMAQYDKAVSLSLDGDTSSVHVFGSTVGDLLAKQDVPVGEHDIVQPAADAPLNDGDTVVVRYGRKLTVTMDGKTSDYWTTATSVDAALAELGIRADTAKLSVSRSEPLGRSGLALTITTPKNVTVNVDGGSKTVASTGPTVADAPPAARGHPRRAGPRQPGARDPAHRGPGRHDQPGREEVGQRDPGGRVRGDQPGRRHPGQGDQEDHHQGRRRRAERHLRRGLGRRQARVPHPDRRPGHQEPGQPGRRRRHQGPDPAPTPPPTPPATWRRRRRPPATPPAPASTSPTPRCGTGSPSASPAATGTSTPATATTAGCSSRRTWLANGGADFAARADLASREQQITVANRLYAKSGLQPWGCKP